MERVADITSDQIEDDLISEMVGQSLAEALSAMKEKAASPKKPEKEQLKKPEGQAVQEVVMSEKVNESVGSSESSPSLNKSPRNQVEILSNEKRIDVIPSQISLKQQQI